MKYAHSGLFCSGWAGREVVIHTPVMPTAESMLAHAEAQHERLNCVDLDPASTVRCLCCQSIAKSGTLETHYFRLSFRGLQFVVICQQKVNLQAVHRRRRSLEKRTVA